MSTRTHRFPGLPESVPAARHFVSLELRHDGCPLEVSDAAALLVTELAANAVLHAASDFAVSIVHIAGSIEIVVTDESSVELHRTEPTTEGGRGLDIVAALAASWGVRDLAQGKAVYFTLLC